MHTSFKICTQIQTESHLHKYTMRQTQDCVKVKSNRTPITLHTLLQISPSYKAIQKTTLCIYNLDTNNIKL